MPELPDLTVYLEGLERRILGRELRAVRLLNPFVLRTAAAPLAVAEGRRVSALRRIGKRLVVVLEGDLFLVLHRHRRDAFPSTGCPHLAQTVVSVIGDGGRRRRLRLPGRGRRSTA